MTNIVIGVDMSNGKDRSAVAVHDRTTGVTRTYLDGTPEYDMYIKRIVRSDVWSRLQEELRYVRK